MTTPNSDGLECLRELLMIVRTTGKIVQPSISSLSTRLAPRCVGIKMPSHALGTTKTDILQRIVPTWAETTLCFILANDKLAPGTTPTTGKKKTKTKKRIEIKI